MGKYGVLDLFCGAGGLSLGFKQAGFDIVMGIDNNEKAIATYNKNFGKGSGICANLLDFGQAEYIESKTSESNVDVIIGGPPCQGFSSANRWSDCDDDERNKLFFQYVKFVDLLKPKVVVIENVAQIITKNNGYAKDAIYEIFKSRGYCVNHLILHADDYGVPQARKRNFFVITKGRKFNFDSLVKKEKTTVYDAISDLYDFEINEDGIYKGTTNLTTEYQKYVRDSDWIYNHYISYPSKETQEKMKYVPQGGNWQDIPPELFKTVRNNRHSSAYKRLKEDTQSVTIDTGNAHSNYYHPKFNRIPTVREAARLQSFPDSFVFMGSKSDQYRQVGNAVPPLLAKSLALAIMEFINHEQ